jgi:hypothetical protein
MKKLVVFCFVLVAGLVSINSSLCAQTKTYRARLVSILVLGITNPDTSRPDIYNISENYQPLVTYIRNGQGNTGTDTYILTRKTGGTDQFVFKITKDTEYTLFGLCTATIGGKTYTGNAQMNKAPSSTLLWSARGLYIEEPSAWLSSMKAKNGPTSLKWPRLEADFYNIDIRIDSLLEQ